MSLANGESGEMLEENLTEYMLEAKPDPNENKTALLPVRVAAVCLLNSSEPVFHRNLHFCAHSS